jgi:transposase
MARTVGREVQETIVPLRPLPGVPFGRGLRLVESGEQRAVVAGSAVLHVWDASDSAAERVVIVSLLRAKQAKQVELGPLLGYHRNTIGRLAERVEEDGMAAVIRAKPGPKRPHKVTSEVLAVLDEGVAAGLGCRRLRRLVEERTGVALSEGHVGHLVRAGIRTRQGSDEIAEQVELDAEVEVEVGATTETIEVGDTASDDGSADDAPVVLPERTRGNRMGAALCYPALEALGLLEAARRCFRLPNSELFGVRAVTLALFFMALLQVTTVEAARFLRRREFGALIGTGRAPVVRTLRRKLANLVSQGQALEFGRQLARRWVEQAMIATAYLYVDGHTKVYTGKRKLREIWNSQRRMPLPGFASYFVGDQRGRPLLFVAEQAGSSLVEAMPRVVAEIRRAVGERRFTLVFDRGGYDSKLFEWLAGEGVDFITYQVGKPNLPGERFVRRRARFGGRRVWLRIAEDTVTIDGTGPWRRIVVLRPDGFQLPVLTSLDPAAPAALIACYMLARWRQENFFRYMRHRMGLDQLVSYSFEQADGQAMVPNPQWRRLDDLVRELRRHLAEVHVELGRAVREGDHRCHRAREAEARRFEAEIERVAALRKTTPKHVPLASTGGRQQPRLEQKAIVDRIKLAAYNAEEWLLERLLVHYPHTHDARALLRSFFELPGEMRASRHGVQVVIDPPDNPLHRRALHGLCHDLSQLGVLYPGTGLPVTYEVEMHQSEAAA